ncbi:MAG: hypothetical protein P4L77_07950 [Sulfuriferula sp.]|nr:hypothetical protein [Sulfuriferula sp.]
MLVTVLALLQGIAPLLHAHVHDLSIPGKIHFHTLEVDANDTPGNAGTFQLTKHLADEDAIGMESAGKNEFDLSITDLTALVSHILVALIPVAIVFTVDAPKLLDASSTPPYLRPYSLAPPALV